MIDHVNTVFPPRAFRKRDLQSNNVFMGLENQKQADLDSVQSAETDLVLIIDDSPAMVEVLSDILCFLNCEVLAALNGEEGLTVYKDRQDDISLVFLDMNMPVMSGEETLRQLREQDPDVRVIVSSCLDELEVRRRCSAEGEAISYFLQKPYQLDQALELVQSALQS